MVILVEMVHDARLIRMNQEHVPPGIRSWLGDSVGHWEGDTLVVDTTNFRDTLALGQASRNLHVVERFTRIKLEEGHALHEAYPPNAELRPLYLEWRKNQPEYAQYPFAFKDE